MKRPQNPGRPGTPLFCLCLGFFLVHISLALHAEEVLDPAIAGESAEEPPSSSPQQPDFLNVRPGIGISRLSLTIRDGAGQQSRLQRDPFIAPFLDLSTKDYRFNEWAGFNLWLHAERFDMDTQSIPRGNFNGSEANSTDFQYPASRGIEGEYYSMHGTVYAEAPFFARIGIGLGTAHVRLSGESEFFRLGPAFLFADTSRSDALEFSRLWLLNSGSLFRGDPVRDYLILGLNQPGNLERLGQYYLLRGSLQFSPEDLVLYRYTGLDANYNLLEFIALTQINREKIRVRSPLLFSPMLYLEYHWLLLTFRIQWSGPRFSQNGYDYTMRSFNFAVMLNWRL